MRAKFESVPWKGAETLIVRRFNLPRFAVPWHFHPEIELTLILEGSGDRCVGDHFGAFASGDLVLLGPNLPHFWQSHQRTKGRSRALVVHVRGEALTAALQHLPEAGDWTRLLAEARRGLFFEKDARAKIAHVMETLDTVDGSKRLLRFLELVELLTEALPDAARLTGEHYVAAGGSRMAARMRKVQQFLYAHLDEVITLEDVAACAGMSPAAFSRYCRRATGRNFTRLVQEMRVTRACQQLSETGLSVSEIAFASGFQSLSSFNRVFREIRGLNPTSYRAAFEPGTRTTL